MGDGGMNPQLILVIEDNPLNMKLVCDLLTIQGYQICSAMDGPSGIAMATARQPDLILLDIQIPGMDGYEVLLHLRACEALKNIPVIALTAHAMKGDREHITGFGFDDYIAKPLDTKGFLEMIKRYMSRLRPA
jgi:CheY-like chemotaxis protein